MKAPGHAAPRCVVSVNSRSICSICIHVAPDPATPRHSVVFFLPGVFRIAPVVPAHRIVGSNTSWPCCCSAPSSLSPQKGNLIWGDTNRESIQYLGKEYSSSKTRVVSTLLFWNISPSDLEKCLSSLGWILGHAVPDSRSSFLERPLESVADHHEVF